jgi:hypothetical protein
MAFGKDKDKDDKKVDAPSNTPAEGPGDQGHGEGDPKLTAIEQARQVAGANLGDQARGTAPGLTVNDPNPHEQFKGTGLRQQTSYQSDEAKAALLDPNDADEIDRLGIRDAALVDRPDEVQIAMDLEALNKKVRVKPKQTVQRFRVGDTWYSIKEGQETLVPQHVAIILEQKGLV